MVSINKCDLVKKTCNLIYSESKHVKINEENMKKFCYDISTNKINKNFLEFNDCDFHKIKNQEPKAIVNFVFILDTLNFCFWPQNNFEYENLSSNLGKISNKDHNLLEPKELIKWDIEFLKKNVFENLDFPLLDERIRLIHEVALIAINKFEGSFLNVLIRSKNSAVEVSNYLILLTKKFYKKN